MFKGGIDWKWGDKVYMGEVLIGSGEIWYVWGEV